jgi:hypothetical protein
MALVREIEAESRSGFHVTAAAPMSGPYDLYGSMRAALSRTTPSVPTSIAIVYEVAAFNDIYGLSDCLCNLLKPPYDAVGQRLMTRGMTQAEANRAVPRFPRDALQADVLASVLNDPDAPLSRALRANDTYDWRPETPMRLYYGSNDLDIPPQNATIAEARMRELGAPDVQAVNLGPLDHGTAQVPAVIAARQWFDTFPAPAASSDEKDDD